MTLGAHTDRLLAASGEIHAAVASSELDHHVTAYRVGNIVGWRQLFVFTTAVSAFAEASAAQLTVIADAIALGADDVERADQVDLDTSASTDVDATWVGTTTTGDGRGRG